MSKPLPIAVTTVVAIAAVLVWLQLRDTDVVPVPVAPAASEPMPNAARAAVAGGTQSPPVIEVERQPAARAANADAPARPSPTQLWGRVVARDTGAPIAGADVELQHRAADEFWNLDLDYGERTTTLAHAQSDADGGFRFEVDRAQQNRLFVRAAGYAPTTVLGRMGGSAVVVEMARGAGIDGVVRADGQPLVDADVRIGIVGQGVELGRARTDAGGAFRLTELAPANVFVQVRSLRYQEKWQRVELQAGVMQHLEIDLQAGKSLSGRVVEATTSLPVVDASVSDSWTMTRTVRTDTDGRFVLAGLRGDYGTMCHVKARGYASAVHSVGEHLDEPIEIRLVRGGEAAGRVVDGDGVPVPSAYVALGANFMPTPGMMQSDWIPAAVGADGRFLALGLRPDQHYSVFVRAAGFGTRVYCLPRMLGSGERLDLGDIVVRAAGGIEGGVVDDTGAVLPEIEVSVRGANADRAQWLATGVRPTRVDQFEGRSVVTNAAGEFRIGGLSAGSYELSVRLSGHADPVRQTVSVQDGEMTAAVEVVVSKGLTIAGRLMLADGGAPTGDIELTATGGDREYAADVAADGSFHFDGVADGAYVISMMLPPAGWSLPPRHDVPAGATDVRLVLERCAVVIGRVVDADGEPVKARVWAEPDAVDLRAVVAHDTDAEGRFRIEVPQGFRGTVNAFDERKRTGEQANVVAGQDGVRITLQGH